KREPGTAVCRPHLAVGIEKYPTRLIGSLGVGPVLWCRRREVSAVLAQIKARLRLYEILDIDEAELVAVIKKLVVFIVPVRWDRGFGWDPFNAGTDLLQQVAQSQVDLWRRHLELLQPVVQPLNLHVDRMWRPDGDPGRVDMPDRSAGHFRFSHE